MSYSDKKVIGVWIDHLHAYIIGTPDLKNEGEYDVLKKIESHFNPSKGKSEGVMNHKHSNELKKLYKEVGEQVSQADAVFIIGPGKAQEELKNFLQEDRHFQAKEIELGTADHLSMNQMVAKIRTHFFHN